jgi:hypothetical protein
METAQRCRRQMILKSPVIETAATIPVWSIMEKGDEPWRG